MNNNSNTGLLKIVEMSLLLALSSIAAADNAVPNAKPAAAPVNTEREYSFWEAIIESNFGDVYAEPSKWQELSYGDLFSKGWDKPWASPPTGGGGAPRQGWLNAYEGVFYRLGIAVFGWQHDLAGAGDGYTGSLTMFTPLNQRFEIQTDIPMAVSNRRSAGLDKETNFGDFQITPRLMLSESRDVTQTFNLTFRTPTGVNGNLGTNIAAVTPNYQFWANWWQGLVVRGGAGFFIPYGGDLNASGARSLFNANLAAGYYFTPHDFTPIGDMVWYLSANMNQTIDNRGPSRTLVTLSPGFRTHMGMKLVSPRRRRGTCHPPGTVRLPGARRIDESFLTSRAGSARPTRLWNEACARSTQESGTIQSRLASARGSCRTSVCG